MKNPGVELQTRNIGEELIAVVARVNIARRQADLLVPSQSFFAEELGEAHVTSAQAVLSIVIDFHVLF